MINCNAGSVDESRELVFGTVRLTTDRHSESVRAVRVSLIPPTLFLLASGTVRLTTDRLRPAPTNWRAKCTTDGPYAHS